MDHLKLTSEPLSVDAISNLVVDNSCGAVSIFVGTTRDNFEEKKVVRLEYEAYQPMALKAMKTICEEVRGQWPAVHGIAIYHRLGAVPCREASVVIAVSSPHRRDSLDAVSACIDKLKASVPIWKREVYDGAAPVWKENPECPPPEPIDKNLVQLNVTPEELEKRMQNFIERKREQVNISNVHDFTPGALNDDDETCARVRTRFQRRTDSKGHFKIRKVHNEWGPQTVRTEASRPPPSAGLPASISERVVAVEEFLQLGPVPPDVYKRLKAIEERIAELQAVSPEYAHFWRNKAPLEVKQEESSYQFSADDIARKIEQLEREGIAC